MSLQWIFSLNSTCFFNIIKEIIDLIFNKIINIEFI
jgi:hypothetical protein